jgi:hypothetical protein
MLDTHDLSRVESMISHRIWELEAKRRDDEYQRLRFWGNVLLGVMLGMVVTLWIVPVR